MITTSRERARGLQGSGEVPDRPHVRSALPAREISTGFAGILACVDGSAQSAAVLAWAAALSRGLNAPMRALQVLDKSVTPGAPEDPLVWELRRREAQNRLQALLAHAGADDAEMDVAVGPFHDRLQAQFDGNAVDLCVIGATGEGASPGSRVGRTARHVVETAPCSVLVVPPEEPDAAVPVVPKVRRLMVPLDCSRRAEAALPTAVALADACEAEIVIIHAVPAPAITEIGPLDEADIALARDVTERNRKAAERYMSRLRARLALERRPIRVVIVSGAEPRHRLVRAAQDEGADLIVLSAKGAGGFADQELGSVADFLVTHLNRPLLIVRPGPDRKAVSTAGRVAGAHTKRPPDRRV